MYSKIECRSNAPAARSLQLRACYYITFYNLYLLASPDAKPKLLKPTLLRLKFANPTQVA